VDFYLHFFHWLSCFSIKIMHNKHIYMKLSTCIMLEKYIWCMLNSFLSLPGRKYACKQLLNVWKPGQHLLKFNHHGLIYPLKVSYDIRMQTRTAISWLENEKYKRNATIRQKIEEIKIFSSKIKLEKLWEHLIIGEKHSILLGLWKPKDIYGPIKV